ncbi:MAG: class I SAM-dependent methyltransferase [Deltaproteobacteria bacterium]|nr:class I SAM-dependent methyltransferase [Deltaproteobacteria bacterium]
MKAQQMLTGRGLHWLFQQVRGGSFRVAYTDGTIEHYGDGEPQFTVRLRDDDIFNLWSGDLSMSFGEAYMDGRFEVEGDLADLVALAIRSGLMSATETAEGLTGTALRVAAGIRSLKRQTEDIGHHYDLGNDFFRLWLDESLTYSCAYFRNASDTLERAQLQKVEHSLGKLRLQPGETLLDIGCGWGALVIRAAERFGVQALGITLSNEQRVGAMAAITSRGLSDKARVQLVDYGTLAREGRQFDKIVSIGMIEHVGKAHLAEFARDVETMLRPGGLALLHLITTIKDGPTNRWVEKYIFPGGYIPTLAEMVDQLSAQDLHIWDVENLGPHYRLTLDEWSERFERAVPRIRERFDERFVRMWRLYLRGFSAKFREATLEVHQILVSRGNPRNLSLTREDIYRAR